jgi:hypothetical protein
MSGKGDTWVYLEKVRRARRDGPWSGVVSVAGGTEGPTK